MSESHPPYAGERPDSDAALRHQPTPVATGTSAPLETPGGGAGAWSNSEASPLAGSHATASGAEGDHPHLFHLTDATANVFPGGGLQGAHEENWPILQGQNGAVYIARLAPSGVREPHWHPSAWELNFVMQGRARWTLVGPGATQDSFEAAKGDLVFAPQGHFHYFENADDTEDLLVLIVFNSSAKEPADDIGIVQSLKTMPPDVLAAVFGGTPEMFANLPGKLGRVVIASKAKLG